MDTEARAPDVLAAIAAFVLAVTPDALGETGFPVPVPGDAVGVAAFGSGDAADTGIATEPTNKIAVVIATSARRVTEPTSVILL